MPLFPNVINSNPNNAINMSTPLEKLPMKQDVNENMDVLNDPVIQGVLNEFETTSGIPPVQHSQPTPPVQVMPEQNVEHILQQPIKHVQFQEDIIQPPPIESKPMFLQNLRYNDGNNNNTKKFFDLNIIKKVLIIVLIVLFLLNTNILGLSLSRLPESISSFFQGKDIYINIVVTISLLYVLMYFEII